MRAMIVVVIGLCAIVALAYLLPGRECRSSAASIEALFAPCLLR